MDRSADLLLAIGVLGFGICMVIIGITEYRVLGQSQFEHQTVEHSAPIEMKGATFFVEPNYASRYHFADKSNFVFWLLAVTGGALKERRMIGAWWEAKKRAR